MVYVCICHGIFLYGCFDALNMHLNWSHLKQYVVLNILRVHYSQEIGARLGKNRHASFTEGCGKVYSGAIGIMCGNTALTCIDIFNV